MKITISMDVGGRVWATDDQGQRLTECFFKTDEETEDELRHWGYQPLLHAYPDVPIAVDTGIAPEDLGELFLEH